MRLSPLIFCIMILGSASSLAAEALIGEWLVPDWWSGQWGARSRVRIEKCGGALWGVVSGELKPGLDSENPEPALRGRPILGMPILLDMKASIVWGWEGHIYNPRNGKTNEANIRLFGAGFIRLEECEHGGVFCGRQEWTRAGTTVPKGNALKAAAPPKAGPPKAATAESVILAGDVCSRVVNVPGRAH
jgi:uncharacterized protein (DUF2147 family)